MTKPTRSLPTTSQEGLWVVRGLLGILVLFLLAVSLRPQPEGRDLLQLPFQIVFHELDETQQALVREMWVAVEELAWILENEQRWARPEELKTAWIVPFAALRLVSGTLEYDWLQQEQAGVCNYLGTPTRGEGPFLLLSLEPAAPTGEALHQQLVVSDGFHQKLLDGSLYHYSLWIHDQPVESGIPVRPEVEGWKQVITAHSFEARS